MHPGESDHFIPIDGVGAVHYVAAGHGPPVVLLHGLGASVVAWRDNIPALSQRYAVFAPDLPGHGESAKPETSYDMEFGLRFVLHYLDALNLAQATLVGNSTGGLLALALALRHPDRVRALVLVDVPGLGREVAWPLRVAALPGIGRLLEGMDMMAGARFAPRLFQHPERVNPEVREELLRLRRLPGVRRAVLDTLRNGVGLLGLRPSYLQGHDSSTTLPVPTLVVWGQEDRIVPARHAWRFARRFPDIQLRVLPDCGHWPQMEQAQAFNQAVMAFLDNVVGVKDE